MGAGRIVFFSTTIKAALKAESISAIASGVKGSKAPIGKAVRKTIPRNAHILERVEKRARKNQHAGPT
jgi:hypothetical protein